MVALMRSTALHAALLSGGAEIPAIAFWRARCSTLVGTLQQDMQDRNLPATDIREFSLAQCVLLDELTLHALPSRQHEEWLADPLQTRFHGVRDGAARVWERIDAVVNDNRQDVARFEFYSVLLELGFDGGRANATTCLERLKSALNSHRRGIAVLSLPAPGETTVTLTNSPRRPLMRRISCIRGTACGVIAGAIAVASLWTALDLGLDAAIRCSAQTPATQSIPIQRKHLQCFWWQRA
ncbi:DotU family type IV/VI secretion system protein [Paraburkholderia sp. MMS20-SJTN17]|uniref:DotU family type IV/VI secretion system protein n=1 Tax=Paraburkholderia translucens TaxID=2886945 RepID=A0ABS8KCW5_9BURK|nr:DotU family type IV/VI secretion system protein [Paraburkholderia sp. MMS20-SJTN17]MCC8402589.1 DotU family type IV/VI secretion system protein [Paraburkholderia sp. MMS20-SJTN17]